MKKLLGVLLLLLLYATPVFSADWSNTSLGNGWTGVVSTHKEPGVNGGTTDAVDSSTGTLLIVVISDYQLVSTTCTPTDSKSNTWTALTTYGDDQSTTRITIWYVNSATPTVGSGHTVTCSATTTYPIIFFAVAKTSAASPLDKANGAASAGGGGTSAQPGSTGTLSEGSQLIITGLSFNSSAAISVDSSFTIMTDVQPVGGTNLGGGLAWLTQSGTGALNPTWTFSSSTWSADIATFKTGTAATVSAHGMLLGVFP